MTDQIDVSLLRCFIAVAEELHFGRAAERLRIAQPSLSERIGRFERRIGCRLLARRPRVALTEAGTVLYRSAQRILRELEDGVGAARRAGRGESGRLIVGFAGSVLLAGFARTLRSFREARPGIELTLREMPTGAQLDALQTGTIDVGLGREAVRRDGVVAELVLRERLIVALPRNHPLTGVPVVSLTSLREEPFILFPRSSTPVLYDQVVAMCRRAGFTPRVVQEAVEWLNIVSLVSAGIGLSIVPVSFRRARWTGVEYRGLKPGSQLTAIHLCYRTGPLAPAVEAFTTTVRQSIASA